MRGFLGILFFGLVAIAAGAIGYQAGIMSGVDTAGAHVVFLDGGPHIGGLFLLLFLGGLLLFAFRGRRHGPWGGHAAWGGRGPWGPGFGPMGDGSDPRRQWVAEAHRRLHEEDARTAGAASGSARPGGTGTGAPPIDGTADQPAAG